MYCVDIGLSVPCTELFFSLFYALCVCDCTLSLVVHDAIIVSTTSSVRPLGAFFHVPVTVVSYLLC